MTGTGLRETKQRAVILDVLRQLVTHPTADEVHQAVKRRLPRISIATVYRNLDLLSRLGTILKIEVGGMRRFDANTSNHHHVRCVRCGRMEDTEVRGITQIDYDAKGYTFIGHRIELLGVCPRCQSEVHDEPDREQAKARPALQ